MRNEREFRKPNAHWPRDYGEPKGYEEPEPVEEIDSILLPDEVETAAARQAEGFIPYREEPKELRTSLRSADVEPELEIPGGEPKPLESWEEDDDFADGRSSAGRHQRAEEDETRIGEAAAGLERPYYEPPTP